MARTKTTFIHVNRHVIARNAKLGTAEPAVRVQRGKHGKSTYCLEAEILGPSRVVYSPSEPLLPCGARLVIATEADVRVVGERPAPVVRQHPALAHRQGRRRVLAP